MRSFISKRTGVVSKSLENKDGSQPVRMLFGCLGFEIILTWINEFLLMFL